MTKPPPQTGEWPPCYGGSFTGWDSPTSHGVTPMVPASRAACVRLGLCAGVWVKKRCLGLPSPSWPCCCGVSPPLRPGWGPGEGRPRPQGGRRPGGFPPGSRTQPRWMEVGWPPGSPREPGRRIVLEKCFRVCFWAHFLRPCQGKTRGGFPWQKCLVGEAAFTAGGCFASASHHLWVCQMGHFPF